MGANPPTIRNRLKHVIRFRQGLQFYETFYINIFLKHRLQHNNIKGVLIVGF